MFDYSEALSAVVLGKHLGSGAFRDVYECKLDDSIVIKIAKDHDGAFHNAKEWETYTESRGNREASITPWSAGVDVDMGTPTVPMSIPRQVINSIERGLHRG